MSKIVLISSGPSIAHYGRMIQNTLPDPENFLISDLYMEEALEYVRHNLPEDTDVIIARGNTAKLLKSSHLSVPIVTIPIRDSELIQSIHKAKELYQEEDSAIAYIGLEDIIQSVREFLQLLHCNIRLYPVNSSKDIRFAVKKAGKDHIRVVIGGIYTQTAAASAGLNCVLLESSLSSVREAYDRALEVQKGFLLQRKKFQERTVLLNCVREGVLCISEKGRITMCNPAGETFLASSASSLSGKSYASIFPQTERELISQVIFSGQQLIDHSFFLNGQHFLLSVFPVVVGSEQKGIILTFRPEERLSHATVPVHSASPVFPDSFFQLAGDHPLFHSAISLGVSYAHCSLPVLILGEEGTGRETFARCIHKASSRSQQIFVSREASLLAKEDIMAAHMGTLYIRHSERLSLSAQELLSDMLETGSLSLGDGKRKTTDVRLIISSDHDLSQILDAGFYYQVNSLILPLPALRFRSSDIPCLVEHFMKQLNNSFKKSCRCSAKFLQELAAFSWPGNLKQLESYLRRLVVISQEDSIFSSISAFSGPDDSIVCSHLKTESPFSQPPSSLPEEPGFIIRGRKITYGELKEMDRFFQGKKGPIAQKLGISRSTLWRYYKQMNQDVQP